MKIPLSLLMTVKTLAQTNNETTYTTTTPQVLANLKLLAEYSAAAYCPRNYLIPLNTTKPICPSAVCPLVQTAAPDVELARAFVNVSASQTTGLAILDHSNELIVFSFGGTHTETDWKTDFDFPLDPAEDICDGCEVHSGFLDSWHGVRDLVFSERQKLLKAYPSYATVLTGHSLGGALATLAAAQLSASNSTSSTASIGNAESGKAEAGIYLFTYGCPRVGNAPFATHLTTLLSGRNFRTTHLNDLVPRIPPKWAGYVHPAPEYSIRSPYITDAISANPSTLLEATNLVVGAKDVRVIVQAESEDGDDGFECGNPAMHGAYFGVISGCLPQDEREEGEFLLPCSGL